MSERDENREENAVVGIIIGFAVVLAIAVSFWTAFGAIAMSSAPATATAAAPAGTVSPTLANAPTAAELTAIAGPVKLYFDTGKNDLPANAADELAPIVEAVKSGRASKAVVAGFHDKTGSADVNAEVSKARAQAVAAALASAGLTDAQIELRRPQETEGDGSDREARRVEVTAEKG